jgi:hypothetical protein
MPTTLNDILRQSLTDCFEHICISKWKGRERELVSLYAFSFLQKHCAPDSVLYDSGQIAIECAVTQVTEGGKALVCKDLLIWPQPNMTTWSFPETRPLVIMEWKARGMNTVSDTAMTKAIRSDVAWLSSYITKHPETLGIAIGVDVTPEKQTMTAHMVHTEGVNDNWLCLP